MAQSLARLWTHLIFSTKDRYPLLNDRTVRVQMHAYLATVLRSHDCPAIVVGGCADHVHARVVNGIRDGARHGRLCREVDDRNGSSL